MATVAALVTRLELETRDFTRGFERAQKDMQGFVSATQSIGRGMQVAGGAMTAAFTVPFVAAAGASLKFAGDFQASMNMVGAVTGAVGEQFDALEDQAKSLGATTQFSASQAADAMYFLASAGFDTNEVLGAMPGTLQLAAAAQMDLATAADITSNILSGYGMEVEELGRVNDVLVRTFQLTNTNLMQLGEAFKYAGPLAKGVGLEFEEAAAAMGLMGNAGIQASMAGTSLRGALTRLIKPPGEAAQAMERLGLTVLNSQGELLSLEEIMRGLEETGATAADMMALFGQRAGPAMAALVEQGSDALSTLTQELRGSAGTAERIAAVQMEGLNGALKELKSAVEAAGIAVAQSGLLDWATSVARRFASLIRRITEVNPFFLRMAVVAGALVAAIGPLLLIGGTLVLMVGSLAGAFAAAATAGITLGGIIATVLGGVGAVLGVATLVAAIITFKDEVGAAVGAVRDFGSKVVGVFRTVKDAVGIFFGGLFEDAISGVKDFAKIVAFEFDQNVIREAQRAAKIIKFEFRQAFETVQEEAQSFGRIMAFELGNLIPDAIKDEATKFGRIMSFELGRTGREAGEAAGQSVADGITSSTDAVADAVEEINDTVESGLKTPTVDWEKTVSALRDEAGVLTGLWDTLKERGTLVGSNVTTALQDLHGKVEAALQAQGGALTANRLELERMVATLETIPQVGAHAFNRLMGEVIPSLEFNLPELQARVSMDLQPIVQDLKPLANAATAAAAAQDEIRFASRFAANSFDYLRASNRALADSFGRDWASFRDNLALTGEALKNSLLRVADDFTPTGLMGGLTNTLGSIAGAFSPLGPLAGAVSDGLARAAENAPTFNAALEGIISTVARVVAPILEAIAPLLRVFELALIQLEPAITLVTKVVAFAANVIFQVASVIAKIIGTVFKVLGKILNLLPGSLGNPLIRAGEKLLGFTEYVSAANDSFKHAGDAADSMAEATNRAAAASSNIPRIFKTMAVAFETRMADVQTAVSGAPTLATGGAPVATGRSSTEVHYHTYAEGAIQVDAKDKDARELYQTVRGETRRQNLIQTGNPLGLR